MTTKIKAKPVNVKLPQELIDRSKENYPYFNFSQIVLLGLEEMNRKKEKENS